MIADVAAVSPALKIQFRGATVQTPVQKKLSDLPTLVVGDEVDAYVDPTTREVVVTGKVVAA